jgi:hypothetical protein
MAWGGFASCIPAIHRKPAPVRWTALPTGQYRPGGCRGPDPGRSSHLVRQGEPAHRALGLRPGIATSLAGHRVPGDDPASASEVPRSIRTSARSLLILMRKPQTGGRRPSGRHPPYLIRTRRLVVVRSRRLVGALRHPSRRAPAEPGNSALNGAFRTDCVVSRSSARASGDPPARTACTPPRPQLGRRRGA